MFTRHLLFVPLLLTGCAAPVAMGGIGAVGLSAVEDRGVGGVASDEVIRVQLNGPLLQKYEYAGVSLTVYRGRVLLTGIVPNEAIKNEVINIAKDVPGVKEIINGLKIQNDDNVIDTAVDSWMTVNLKGRLYADQDVYAPNYVVTTFDRVIYVFGVAETPQERQAVIQHAYDISGVRKVMNLVQCKGQP